MNTMDTISAARIVAGKTGDRAGRVVDAGAGGFSLVTSGVTGTVTTLGTVIELTGATTVMTVLYGSFREGVLTVIVYCPGARSPWNP